MPRAASASFMNPPSTSGSSSSTLSPGARFGSYEILQRLGAGGMGEVYRAKDSRLDREVAIKTLSLDHASHPEALSRFEQEARSASSLNHPNIVTIYELGHENGTRYIAMELVDGETVRALLASGPIPFRKLVAIAAQVADGLAKAHEIGLIHRDLKPENLMVSCDGTAKVLDFGLAKLHKPDRGSSDSSTTITENGTVVGTVGYMSPEQATGEDLDFRSDQFSFGSVLYEMATGTPAFRKKTHAETMAAILRDEPERLGAKTLQAPAPFIWIIERCLAKDPKQRYSSTRDLARDLAAVRDRLADVPGRELETRPNNLPVQRTAFIGRERETADLRQLLSRPDVHLVTLTGPGGIGKTRLALQAAGEMADQFPSGVCFVALSAIDERGLIFGDRASRRRARDRKYFAARKLDGVYRRAAPADAPRARQLRAPGLCRAARGANAHCRPQPQSGSHQPGAASPLRRTRISGATAGATRSRSPYRLSKCFLVFQPSSCSWNGRGR